MVVKKQESLGSGWIIKSRDLPLYIYGDLIKYLPCTGKGIIKNPSEVAGLLNRATCYEGLKCVFGCTEKYFCLVCDDLNNVTMELLG